MQGVGGGGMLIVVTVLLSDYIPLRERGTYQAYLNLLGAVGSTSGGPLGALWVQLRHSRLSANMNQRWLFRTNNWLEMVRTIF